MKKTLLFLLLSTFIILLLGCKKNVENDPNPNAPLTEKEKQEIISSHDEIAKKANKILLEDSTAEDFEKLIPEIQNYPMVEKVWVKNNTLWIQFKKGGVISWYITKEETKSPYKDGFRKISNSFNGIKSANSPSNNKVCLINQVYKDEGRPYCKEIILDLSNEFQKNGFDVTIKNGEYANVSLFEKDFNKYGVIFSISHGGFDGNITWLYTGEDGNFAKLYGEFYNYWINNQVGIGYCKEIRGGKEEIIPFFKVSNKLFDAKYTQNSFPNSLIYWVACYGMKGNLGQTLSSKGVGVTVGWDESDCMGPFSGQLLLQGLLNGNSLQEAFEALPEEYKVDYCAVESGAKLVYYPTSGGNIKLTSENALKIITPKYGTIYHCGEWVDVYVSGYTGADWRENLKVQLWCLAGNPQPSNPNESGTYIGELLDRKEEDYSFTFSPETPSI